MNKGIILLLVFSFILTACSAGISSDQAVINAEQFLYSRGKFFSSDTPITNITFTNTDIYRQGNDWNVGFLIQGQRNGSVVSNSVRVVIDSKGNVIGAQAAPK